MRYALPIYALAAVSVMGQHFTLEEKGVDAHKALMHNNMSGVVPIHFLINGEDKYLPRGVFLEGLVREPIPLRDIGLASRIKHTYRNQLSVLAGIFSGKEPVNYNRKTGLINMPSSTSIEVKAELGLLNALTDIISTKGLETGDGKLTPVEVQLFQEAYIRTLNRFSREAAERPIR
ncbi:MAG: hypothetical protein ACE5FT_05955 [Candidatus Nanoarchaeia archaeon]